MILTRMAPTKMPEARFKIGELVQRANQPESTGVVREVRLNAQVERYEYVVQFSGQRVGVPEAQLQPLASVTSPWQALAEGRVSGRTHFISSLTYERLTHPPARIANSFATARTRFYPYQFKPLLKFLDHPGKRLLLADDVGLGKTIEAGYILRELDAHRKAERILVVVPARLATKWKKELETKFDEKFEKVTGRDLLAQARRMASGQEPDPFRWIVSYESVRSEDIRRELEATQLPLDVLIADEAHRMRNPESLQHRIGAVLSICADAAVFLSATPVMNRLEDLWNLLKLLSPEEFGVWQVFRERVESARFILAAQRALAVQPPRLSEARSQVERFADAMADGHRPGQFLKSVQDRLETTPASRRELIELQADVGRLSPIGHIVSRTRKADAVIDRPERVAHWQHVELNAVEREIYDSVQALCREAGMGGSTPWGFEMSLLMAYRATASCIPAAIDYFSDKLKTTSCIDLEDFEEESESLPDAEAVSAWSGPIRTRFREIVDLYRSAEPSDSKLDSLLVTLQEIWADDDAHSRPRRKVVIFSFFRGTLNYLHRRLTQRGLVNRRIHGGIPISEREAAIEEFLKHQDIAVLLTSEVGGEGIDLVQASVVINYDLPWNPMVVEQRIGRVDRIGQDAKRIIVRNFVVKGSVEERVLSRLLAKIAIFLQTIGDLEPIIGERIDRLTKQALRGELSEEEIERRVEEEAAILDRTRLDALEVLSQADGLLASDQALIDEIEALTGERQIPSHEELFLFLNKFFEEFYPGCQLPLDSTSSIVSVDLSGLAVDMLRAGDELGLEIIQFARELVKGPVELTLSRDAGLRRPRAVIVHLQHPLAKFSVWKLSKAGTQQKIAFRLAIQDNLLPPGRYAFLIESVDVLAHRPSTRLASIFASRDDDRVLTNPDVTTPVLVAMLRSGTDVHIDQPSAEETTRLKDRLVGGLQSLLAEWEARESKLEAARQERLRSSQLAVLQFRLKRAEERVRNLKASQAAEFPVRMADAKLAIAKREYTEFLDAVPPSTWGGISHREVAVGLLTVTPEEN